MFSFSSSFCPLLLVVILLCGNDNKMVCADPNTDSINSTTITAGPCHDPAYPNYCRWCDLSRDPACVYPVEWCCAVFHWCYLPYTCTGSSVRTSKSRSRFSSWPGEILFEKPIHQKDMDQTNLEKVRAGLLKVAPVPREPTDSCEDECIHEYQVCMVLCSEVNCLMECTAGFDFCMQQC